MIRIENVDVFGWDAAVRGMRNPLESWEKSDSFSHLVCENGKDRIEFVVGKNDLDLMCRLVKAGSDHSKFMRMIHVQCDIVAPLYWWKEASTYKVGVVENSCSTMHKIHAKEFTLSDFSHDHMVEESVNMLKTIIDALNEARCVYNDFENVVGGLVNGLDGKKDVWWQMIQLLPASYNQRRTIDLNYAVLRNIYHARSNHKLDEWHTFCQWIESLPYAELIVGCKK